MLTCVWARKWTVGNWEGEQHAPHRRRSRLMAHLAYAFGARPSAGRCIRQRRAEARQVVDEVAIYASVAMWCVGMSWVQSPRDCEQRRPTSANDTTACQDCQPSRYHLQSQTTASLCFDLLVVAHASQTALCASIHRSTSFSLRSQTGMISPCGKSARAMPASVGGTVKRSSVAAFAMPALRPAVLLSLAGILKCNGVRAATGATPRAVDGLAKK